MNEQLSNLHLADLHRRAAELGIERFRMLTRAELIEAIQNPPKPKRRGLLGRLRHRDRDHGKKQQEASRSGERRRSDPAERERERARSRRGGDGRRDRGRGGDSGGRDRQRGEGAGGRDRGRGRSAPRDERPKRDERDQDERDQRDERSERDEAAELAEATPAAGILDRLPQGHGFLRLEGYAAAEGDVYISASQIRRCRLRPGDLVEGPARPPREGERHPALVKVDSVNGGEPGADRADFERGGEADPERRLLADDAEGPPGARAIDLLAPLAFGQRVLLLSDSPGTGAGLLRDCAAAARAAGASVLVILAGEGEGGADEWRRSESEAEVVTGDPAHELRKQVHTAELAVSRAKRRAEAGEDVVILVDSLTGIAAGYKEPARIKRIFGAGRELKGADGSVTVIALADESAEVSDRVLDAIEEIETGRITLSSELADAGSLPIVVGDSGPADGPDLRSGEAATAQAELLDELAEKDDAAAARSLAEKIESTPNNAALLS